MLTTIVGVCRLVASILFGALWTWWGMQTAALLFAAGLLVALALAAMVFARMYKESIGVTFTRDSGRFYATLGTGGTTYLIEGDVATRVARVLRENVECPSISPDNTRLVFKKRISSLPGPVAWRLHMLDLATGVETPLADARNVDDQAEWLDNDNVVYFLLDEGPPATIRPDVWTVPADGSGTPRLLRTGAFSPVVVRP